MKLVYTMDNKINGLRWRDIMSLFIKRSTALLMAAILALNLVGINTFAEESDNEDTVNATPFEIDDEFSVSEEEGNSTEDNITDKIEENDEPIDSDSDVIVDKLLITGFADLDVAFFSVEEKLPVEELGLPEQLPVYINDVDEVVYIDVNWICNDDYENTEYERYTFNPVWDDSFELDVNLDAFTVPFIEVEILYAENINQREGIVATPEEGDYDFDKSTGTIKGLNISYLETLTDEQKQNINLVIPESINGTPVIAIGINAFSLLNNSNIKKCEFIGLDFSKASNLKIIGNGAFQNCHINQSLILPINLETIGQEAFRLGEEKIGFTGKLIIPETVTSIGAMAFSKQRGLTSVEFKGNNITELPNSVFRYCSGLSGVLRIPDSVIKIGSNTFTETNITTLYLPKVKEKDKQLLVSTSFQSNKINAIVCDKDDFATIKTWVGNTLASKIGYEITIKFETNGEGYFEPITRLFNRTYDMVKNAEGEWLVTNYKLPEVEGKKWRNKPTSITPLTGRYVISSDTLYLFVPYEDPIITYSEDIDKTYDGQPITLTVTASHPLAKSYKEATEGDVVFKYTWHFATIGSSPNVSEGFDENEYSFFDVRDSTQTITCTVKIQGCVRINGKNIQFFVEEHDFKIFMHQADPIVNPEYSTHVVDINGALPEIKLSEGDTPGTIIWDSGQTLKLGTHEYTWTYKPEINKEGKYNYKEVKGSSKIFAKNGDAFMVTSENCTNGSIILDKPYGALKGEDVTITFKPNNGYKLSSAELDTNNILNSLIDNKYTLKNIESNHSVSAKFESMKTEDIEGIINNLPDIRDDVITEEVKNDILDAKLHYDAVNGSTDGDITEDAKEKMYEAISKLDQVETVVDKKLDVSNNIEVTNEVHLLENMETEDAETLKNSNTASLKIELVVDNATIEDEKEKVLQSVLGDAVVGESFDVSVVKKLIQGSSITEKPLTELKAPIQLVFDVPANLPTIESGCEREFFIIRLHTSDKGEIIADRLEDEDNQANTISVSSDKFSTYTIAYKDVKKDNGSQGGGSGSYSKTYTVKFETLGGTHVDAITDIKQGKKLTQPANPRRKGYTFTGWFADEKCTKPFDFTKDTIKANMTLYAGWEKIEEIPLYDVSFNTSGGTNISKQSIEEGQKVLLPAVPSKEGYIFTGWYLDEACTLPLNFDMYTVHANTVIYAGWQKNDESTNQTVVNEPNNTTNEPESNEPTHGEPFESEEGIHKVELRDTLDPSTTWIMEVDDGELIDLKDMPEKEGYVFKGYFIDKKCTIPFIKDEPIQKDLKLYAGWDKVEESKNDGNKAEDDKDQHKEEQDTNNAEEVPVKNTASSTLYIIILVIVLVLGGIFILLKKKKK